MGSSRKYLRPAAAQFRSAIYRRSGRQPGGDIVATLNRTRSLRIRADTGTVSAREPILWPHFLPDGKRLIYAKRDGGILYAYLEDFASGHASRLMATDTQAIYVPSRDGSKAGYIVFGRGSTLLAQRFDPDRPNVESEPAGIAEGVPFFRPTSWSEFDASADGHVIFGTGTGAARIVWIDRSGRETAVPGEARGYWTTVRLDSKSGRVAADVADFAQGGTDVWILNPENGAAQRVTFDPGVEASPIWSPDGRRIAFGSAQATTPQLRILTLGASGPAEPYPPAPFQLPSDWSPDGRWIAFQTSGGDVGADIWFASTGPDRKIYPNNPTTAFRPSRSGVFSGRELSRFFVR